MLTTETTPCNSGRCIVAPPSNATAQQHPPNDATNRATTAQQEGLKALASKLLQRNGTRNNRATEGEKTAQQMTEKTAHSVARVAGQIVSVSELPKRLVAVATLYCLEVHQDGPKQINEMLADLCWNDPADWNALIDHFEQQLPPPPPKAIPALVTCSGCRHAEYRQHPAIAHCRMGVKSGVPAGGWFDTDRHFCEK